MVYKRHRFCDRRIVSRANYLQFNVLLSYVILFVIYIIKFFIMCNKCRNVYNAIIMYESIFCVLPCFAVVILICSLVPSIRCEY